MARHKKERSGSFADEGEPDLPPLIDCVFLLLILFMVATVFLHTKGLEVDLPAKSDPVQEQKKDINVLLDENGRIEIRGEAIEKMALGPRLVLAMDEANNKNIIIQAQPECAQKHVVYVVDTAKGVGVEGIAFAREEEE